MERQLIAGEVKVEAIGKRAPVDGPMVELWEGWIETHRGEFSAATIRTMGPRLSSLREFDATVSLAGVDRAFLLSYGRWLQRKGYGPNTVFDRTKRLRMIVATLRRENGLPELVELEKLGFKWHDTGEKYLTREEFTRLEQWTPTAGRSKWPPLARDLWLFSLYTGGMRLGDLTRIDRSWIKGQELHHRNKKPPYTPRIIPLLPQAIAILERYPSRGLWNPLRGDHGGKDLDGVKTKLNTAIKAVCRECYITKPVTMHWARHSAAEHLHSIGVDDRSICMLMGISLKTLQTYYWTKWSQRMAADAMKKAWG